MLTKATSGTLEVTRVLAVQHAAGKQLSQMLTLHTSDGATLSLTPDHALFVDGTLVATADAKVGSTLVRANGAAVKILRIIDAKAAAVINPVTASGTILASDVGAPVLAASHPMWIAPLVLQSPLVRVFVNSAVYTVGDVTDMTNFCMILFAKTAAALAIVIVGAKVLQRGATAK